MEGPNLSVKPGTYLGKLSKTKKRLRELGVPPDTCTAHTPNTTQKRYNLS